MTTEPDRSDDTDRPDGRPDDRPAGDDGPGRTTDAVDPGPPTDGDPTPPTADDPGDPAGSTRTDGPQPAARATPADAPVHDAVDEAGDETDDDARRGEWTVSGDDPTPVEIEVIIDVGRVDVRLAPPGQGDPRVGVEVRHDPDAGGSWGRGVGNLLSWLSDSLGGAGRGGAGGAPGGRGGSGPPWAGGGFGGQFGGQFGGGQFGGGPAETAADAVRAAEITWSSSGRRLVVRSATDPVLRAVPLAVVVIAPAGARLALRTGSGEVTVAGRPSWAGVRTGSGDVAVEQVDGDTDVQTGSGRARLGAVSGRARVRTGSGTIELAGTGGPTEVRAASGDVRIGEVHADLTVRTGSGDVDIDDAHQGRVALTTGSGTLRIGVHPGVRAELDLACGSGRARSELEVDPLAPAGPATLQLSGHTGSGDVLVRRAAITV